MSLPMRLWGAMKGATVGSESPTLLDQGQNFLVAQGSSPYAEAARAGGIWNVTSAAGTPLVVIPTTLAILEIYNNTGSGMVMDIVEVFYFHLLGTAALHNISIWAMVTSPKVAPSTASLAIGSQSGRAKYTDTAGTRVTTGAGTTVIANGWRPVGTTGPGVVSTALPGEAQSFRLDGSMLVPTGCALALTCVDALATASSVQLGAVWNERTGITVVS